VEETKGIRGGGVDLHDDRKLWHQLVIVVGKRKGRGFAFMATTSGDVGSLVFAAFIPEHLDLGKGRRGD
jgi:hypothetical protein